MALMETHTMRDVSIIINGEQVATLPVAVVHLDLGKIEVVINEVLLSNETLNLLRLCSEQTPKKFKVIGKVNGKTLVIDKAMLGSLTFEYEEGKAVRLKDISILGLIAEWKP